MTTFALRLISPTASLFSSLLHSYLLFSCPKWLVLPGYISEGVLYFTDFISRWSVVEVAGRQLFFTSVSLYFFFFVLGILIESVIWASSSETKRSHARPNKKERLHSLCVCCFVVFCVCCAQTQVLSAGVLRLEVSLTLVAPWNIYPSVDVVSRSVQSGEAE
jgi:hypothetical protein